MPLPSCKDCCYFTTDEDDITNRVVFGEFYCRASNRPVYAEDITDTRCVYGGPFLTEQEELKMVFTPLTETRIRLTEKTQWRRDKILYYGRSRTLIEVLSSIYERSPEPKRWADIARKFTEESGVEAGIAEMKDALSSWKSKQRADAEDGGGGDDARSEDN